MVEKYSNMKEDVKEVVVVVDFVDYFVVVDYDFVVRRMNVFSFNNYC